jgi:hypothetical protein
LWLVSIETRSLVVAYGAGEYGDLPFFRHSKGW